MYPLPPWVTALSALLTPLIAALAVYIAWQQSRTSTSKLKLDLFDRRFAIYEAASDFLGTMRSGKISGQALFDFLRKTSQARFLLNGEIADYFYEELYSRALDLQTLESELDGLPVGDERSRNVKAQREIKDWFEKQLQSLDRRFAPFLDLRH